MSDSSPFKSELNIQQAVAKFKRGELTWTVEMGGMGPGYEQAIQLLAWEAMARWGDRPVTDHEEFSIFFGSVAKDLAGGLGLSGAQYGAARGLAHAFLTMGYVEAMNSIDDANRRIMFSTHFPRLPEISE